MRAEVYVCGSPGRVRRPVLRHVQYRVTFGVVVVGKARAGEGIYSGVDCSHAFDSFFDGGLVDGFEVGGEERVDALVRLLPVSRGFLRGVLEGFRERGQMIIGLVQGGEN